MDAPDRRVNVEVRNLTKAIKHRLVLDDVSFAVRSGEVVGFIGPNGAGKSTMLRILAGLSNATSGSVTFAASASVDDPGPRGDVGLVPESPGFIEHLSGRTNLLLLASIRKRASAADVVKAIRDCGLDPTDRRPVSKYSLGMRQRLGLAQAVMERPATLLMDEPTNGLDVLGVRSLREIVRRESERGTAVLLCSHLLTEVELACDRVLIMDEGKLLRELIIDEVRRLVGRVRISVTTPHDWEVLANHFDARRSDGASALTGVIVTDRPIPEIARTLIEAGVAIEEIGPSETTLEAVFVDLVDRPV